MRHASADLVVGKAVTGSKRGIIPLRWNISIDRIFNEMMRSPHFEEVMTAKEPKTHTVSHFATYRIQAAVKKKHAKLLCRLQNAKLLSGLQTNIA